MADVTNLQMPISEVTSDDNQPHICQQTISHQTAKKRHSYLRFPYRLFSISETGGIFMIVLNTFVIFALSVCFLNAIIQIEQNGFLSILVSLPSASLLLLCPIIGLLTECYFGRYKILQASMYSLLVAIVIIGFIIIADATDIWYVALVPLSFSVACYTSCIIPFTMDQLVGASGEELSFTIYWLVWPITFCGSTLICFICYLPHNLQYLHTLLFCVASLSFVIAFCLIHCCNNVLMTKSQISNPVKLVASVLNYARKHTFPERRSAFTYWEEECPSRIDLGKDKYGGPFTTEEVEDVKSVLKLIPLISCILPVISIETPNRFGVRTMDCNISELHFWIRILWYFLAISCLPIYQFLIYPLFYNYIPSMLRRIGCGMLVIVISHAFISGVEIYIVEQSYVKEINTTFICTTFENEKLPVSSWSMLVSYFIKNFGVSVTTYTTVEFIIAQTPCQLRGFVTSISLGMWSITFLLKTALDQLIPECYIPFITMSVVSIILFVLFLFVSKWYKQRKRNDVIPYHMFAEDQFESNFRQERNYLKNVGRVF